MRCGGVSEHKPDPQAYWICWRARIELLDEHRAGHLPHLFVWHGDRAERRVADRREGNVVKTYDGQVVRHFDTQSDQGAEESECTLIIETEHQLSTVLDKFFCG